MVRYINNSSEPDSSVQTDHFAWLQGGYTVGSADGQTADTTEVYAENNDLNVSSPHLHLYPSLSRGNHFFFVYWTGETGYGGRGLYEATYSDNFTFLASAYLIGPMSTQQEAVAEGYLGDSAGYCPEFVKGLFGTNGDVGNLSWNGTTELYIYNNQGNGNLVQWTPANIATSNLTDHPPYSVATFSNYDAYNTFGGGP